MKYTKKLALFLLLLFLSIATLAYSKNTSGRKQVATTLPATKERQFSYFFYEALKHQEAGRHDMAIELLAKCAQINNQNADLMYQFANIYAEIGKIDYAIYYLSHAIGLDDDNTWYRLNLASLYLASEDVKNATLTYESIYAKHPEKDEIAYTLIELYGRQQRFQDAINVLNKLEKKHGINEDLSFEKFRIYSNTNEEKKAIKEIDALINKFPHEMRYQLLRGIIYEETDPKSALEIYNNVLEKEPNNPTARLYIADFYFKKGGESGKSKAIEEMKLLMSNKNIDVETKIASLDQFLDATEKEKIAGEIIEILIKTHPNVPEAIYYYAVYSISQKNFDNAKAQFEKWLEIEPKNPTAWVGILEIQSEQNKLEDVIATTQRAIEALPEQSSEWYLYQGIAYFQLKQYDDAIHSFEKGVALVPNSTENGFETDSLRSSKFKSSFYGQIGDAYLEKKETGKAFESYEKALMYNPQNAHVLNNYSYYLAEEKKDLFKAEAMIKECISLVPPSETVLDTYAWVLFQQKYYNLAKKEIERAMLYGGDKNDVVVEHYGDILYMTGDVEKAVQMWKKSLELGNESPLLLVKIEKQEYIEQ